MMFVCSCKNIIRDLHDIFIVWLKSVFLQCMQRRIKETPLTQTYMHTLTSNHPNSVSLSHPHTHTHTHTHTRHSLSTIRCLFLFSCLSVCLYVSHAHEMVSPLTLLKNCNDAISGSVILQNIIPFIRLTDIEHQTEQCRKRESHV